MTKNVKPVPDGFHTVTPHMTVKGCAQAIEFYKQAFGAEELSRNEMPGGNVIMHALLAVGDSMVMLNDEFPQGPKAPSEAGSSVTIHMYVEDADAAWKRAVDAGAEVVFPLDDTFWGDRYGVVKDPFGHSWSIGTHVEDVPPEEMAERAAKAFAQT